MPDYNIFPGKIFKRYKLLDNQLKEVMKNSKRHFNMKQVVCFSSSNTENGRNYINVVPDEGEILYTVIWKYDIWDTTMYYNPAQL